MELLKYRFSQFILAQQLAPQFPYNVFCAVSSYSSTFLNLLLLVTVTTVKTRYLFLSILDSCRSVNICHVYVCNNNDWLSNRVIRIRLHHPAVLCLGCYTGPGCLCLLHSFDSPIASFIYL